MRNDSIQLNTELAKIVKQTSDTEEIVINQQCVYIAERRKEGGVH